MTNLLLHLASEKSIGSSSSSIVKSRNFSRAGFTIEIEFPETNRLLEPRMVCLRLITGNRKSFAFHGPLDLFREFIETMLAKLFDCKKHFAIAYRDSTDFDCPMRFGIFDDEYLNHMMGHCHAVHDEILAGNIPGDSTHQATLSMYGDVLNISGPVDAAKFLCQILEKLPDKSPGWRNWLERGLRLLLRYVASR